MLYQARRVLRTGQPLDDELAADVRRVTSQARNALGNVNVQAPERIRAMLRASMIRRSDLSIALLAGQNSDDERVLWYEAQREYRILRVAMRKDLGLDGAGVSNLDRDPFGHELFGLPILDEPDKPADT